MAHILLALRTPAERSAGREPIRPLVEGALATIQPIGVRRPLTIMEGENAVLGVSGQHGPGTCVAIEGTLSGALETTVRLPGLVLTASPHALEAHADSVGSRTLWFCEAGETCWVSTSQRALVHCLGDFRPSESTVGWFLVTGSCGPGLSWDARIRALPPGATLRFTAGTQAATVTTFRRDFVATKPQARLREELLEAIRAVASTLPEGAGVGLSLSGGLDSRVLLRLAAHPAGLRCFTWGAPDSLARPGTDAAVAKQVAEHLGAPFRFVAIARVAFDEALNRYVAASEGRVDHVTGYLDGMELWRSLAEEHDIRVLLRGDEAFGWVPVLTSADVRRSVGAPLLSDFGNAASWLSNGLGELAVPELPKHLQRRRAETRASWRDRLYQEFRIPSVLAALTTTKASYIETLNPLIDERILAVVRALRDADRTDKRLFRELERESLRSIRVPLANVDGALPLAVREVAANAAIDLESAEATALLSPRLRQYLLAEARRNFDEAKGPGPTKAGRLRRHLPQPPRLLRRLLRNTVAVETLSVRQVLLRASIMVRTLRLLRADAQRLAEQPAGPRAISSADAAIAPRHSSNR